QIITNAVNAMKKMGIKLPKVAVLAAIEEVNQKMPETVDAYELKKMNKNGDIKDCLIEGPISYDLAIDKEAAEIKGYDSPVAGDADLLVVPNITAGNLIGKSLVYSGNSKLAGFVIGAKTPIVLTSRSSSTEDKYLSLVLVASGDWRKEYD
ncbi:MAG: phosphate butyryltransferase, partial [Firmicutes bacterium HGW-Firmicutes-12]